MNNFNELSLGIDPDNGDLEKFVVLPSFSADASVGMGDYQMSFEWRDKNGKVIFRKNDNETHPYGVVHGNKRITNNMQKYDDEGKELVNMEDYTVQEPVLDEEGNQTYTKKIVEVAHATDTEENGDPVMVPIEVNDQLITEGVTKQREVSKQTIDKFDEVNSMIGPTIKELTDPILAMYPRVDGA